MREQFESIDRAISNPASSASLSASDRQFCSADADRTKRDY
ncbi:hypothetical protein [Chamaesiphon sp. VAR_69_metabat_338]|nr:hypothetical protein [Chamaesiphon sp. VAR_69_metabat_338]